MKSSYRLIKLRNGEDLICEIKGQTKDKLKLFRPMLVYTQIVANPFGKTGKMTTLQNWVEHTLDNDIKIPKDFVLTFSPPNESIIELYEKYKNSEDVDIPTYSVLKTILNHHRVGAKPKLFLK